VGGGENLKSTFKNRTHNLHSKNTIFSLVSLLFVLVLLFSSVASTSTLFVSGASDVTVKNETELRAAVNNAIEPTIIALTADIVLTSSALNIPVGKDITLMSDKSEGFWKLTGANGQDTITVDGTLTLDGIIVTHKNGEIGRGVTVNRDGTLIMNSGMITNNVVDGIGGGVRLSGGSFVMSDDAVVANNTAQSGGGVGVYSSGSFFSMSDNAVVTNNTAYSYGGGLSLDFGSFEIFGNAVVANNTAAYGGGVSLYMECFFKLYGNAMVANNTAAYGGGVGIHWGVTFSMCDNAMVANNTAAYGGGGVYVTSGSNAELLGGKVSGNVASGNGGGVWITDDNFVTDFGRLSVASGVVFENNRASTAYSRASTHDAVYDAQIKSNSWTEPFTQGYNNYDISYTAGTLLTYSVSVSGNYSSPSGAGTYLTDSTVTVNAGSRSGYTFSGWTVTEGGITLSNTPTATFTMPARNVAITANWTTVTSGGDGGSGSGGSGSGGGSSSKPSPSPSTPTPSEPTPSTPSPSPSPSDSGNIESKFPITTVLVIVIVALVIVVLAVVGIVVWLLRKSSKA